MFRYLVRSYCRLRRIVRDGQRKRYNARIRYIQPRQFPVNSAAENKSLEATTMNAKRFLPLALLYASDGEIRGKTRFQKLAFLAEKDLEKHGISPYDFIAYDYGPFSKDILEETEALAEDGLTEITERNTFGGDVRYDYRLTPKGTTSYEENRPSDSVEVSDQPEESDERFRCIHSIADNVVSDFGEMPVSNLINHVYSEYPGYAKNSVFY